MGERSSSTTATGTLWVGTADGLARRNPGGDWITYTQGNSGLPLERVTSLAVDDERGRIWVGDTVGGGLALYPPPFNDVAVIVVDNAGVVWVGSAGDGGLAALSLDRSWTTFTASTSDLPGDRVATLLADPAGGVWIGATATSPSQQSGVTHLLVEIIRDRFAEQLPVVPLFMRAKIAAYTPYVTGFILDSTARSELWNIEAIDIPW